MASFLLNSDTKHTPMNLRQACFGILTQLTDLVTQINEHDFTRPAETLSKSTIGQHIRHTLEFFLCLEHGYSNGVVNYDKRAHDKLIESDKYIALSAIERVRTFIASFTEKPLKLEVGYDLEKENFITIETTSTRELVYNIEHAVHHMAIIKIGLREIAAYVNIDPGFGIAASTIRYKDSTISIHH